jgi:hypothetical protein
MKAVTALVLAMALALGSVVPAGARVVAAGDQEKNSNLQEALRKAMPETPSETGGHVLGFVLELVDAIHVGLGAAEVVGAVGLAAEVIGPLAGEAAVFVALGNAHAEAINSVITDQMFSGFSRGVVLGADHRSVDYVKSNFVKWSPVPNSVYPEYGKRFQNAYNQALIAGYAQGKKLTKEESGAFFSDLFSRMSVNPAVTYGPDSKQWSDKTWVDYYVETAAVFRAHHLKTE